MTAREAMAQLFPEPLNEKAFLIATGFINSYVGDALERAKRYVAYSLNEMQSPHKEIETYWKGDLIKASARYQWLCTFPGEPEAPPLDAVMAWAREYDRLPDLSAITSEVAL